MSSIITGAQTVLSINGTPYAWVMELDYNIGSPQKPIQGIDTLLPLDAAPGPVSCNATATLIRRRLGGSIEGDGMLPTWDAATRGKYFWALVTDRATDTTLFESHKCLITSQAWRVATRNFVVGTVSWLGLTYNGGAESPT